MAGDDWSEPLETFGFETGVPLEEIPLHSTNLLTVLDERGIIQYESPAIERIYGFRRDELVGTQVAEYFHPDDRERVVDAFRTVVASDEYTVEAVEYRHEQADGSYKWIESVASANPTPQGYYVVNSRDISARKRRERELEDTRAQAQSERDGKEAIRRLLLQTSSDQTIADNTCELLVDSYGYDAAWIVRHSEDSSDELSDTVTVASYGDDRGFRTEATAVGAPSPASSHSLDDVTKRTLVEGEPVTVTTDTPDEGDIVARLTECGLFSVRSVPLIHDSISYGALTVVRTDPPTEVSRTLVEEFASAIAFKRRVHQQQATLAAETVLEFEVRITDGHVLTALSSSALLPDGVRLDAYELQHSEGVGTCLIETDDTDAEALEAAARTVDGISEPVRFSTDRTVVLRVRVQPTTLGTVLGKHGGALTSMVARDGRLDVTVQFPRLTDSGTVSAAIRDHWPEATIRSRRERVVDDERPSTFERLTDKQEQALRAASVMGFFDRPQGATATDVADTLGVSRSTFLHHLRTAERKVFGDAFGDER